MGTILNRRCFVSFVFAFLLIKCSSQQTETTNRRSGQSSAPVTDSSGVRHFDSEIDELEFLRNSLLKQRYHRNHDDDDNREPSDLLEGLEREESAHVRGDGAAGGPVTDAEADSRPEDEPERAVEVTVRRSTWADVWADIDRFITNSWRSENR